MTLHSVFNYSLAKTKINVSLSFGLKPLCTNLENTRNPHLKKAKQKIDLQVSQRISGLVNLY